MIRWIRLWRAHTNSFLTVEMVAPVNSMDQAINWAKWKYPGWDVTHGSPCYIHQDQDCAF